MITAPLLFVCGFTLLIHLTETVAYTCRLAGVRTKQVAIALSFVTSTLLVSRLSNMFQAPVLGAVVDNAILSGSPQIIASLATQFRFIIAASFIGTCLGMILTPTMTRLIPIAIQHFLTHGSLIRAIGHTLHQCPRHCRWPRLRQLSSLSLQTLPRSFLVFNIIVSAIYTIGVLCSLLAGAFQPDIRATAIQLSGIINGMATILLTLFVDPMGARLTDQAVHHKRSDNDIRSVVVFLQLGKLLGTGVIAQLCLMPGTRYIEYIAGVIATVVN